MAEKKNYDGSEIVKMLDKQREGGKEAIALFSDIDHTYYMKGKENEVRLLTATLLKNNIPTIAVTGNSFSGVLERIQTKELPYFQAIAGSVGTELWIRKEIVGKKEYVKDICFEEELKKTGFNRSKLLKKSFEMIQDLTSRHPEWRLAFQSQEHQEISLKEPIEGNQKFKISFYFFATKNSYLNVANEVQKYFLDQKVVVCEEIAYNSHLRADEREKKYCLDILPGAKSAVVNYLGKKLGIRKGIVAGDSGNDIDMLLNSDPHFTAILVGGAKSEAIRAIHDKINTRKGKQHFYRLQSHPNKHIYTEQKVERVGPASILHALSIIDTINKPDAL